MNPETPLKPPATILIVDDEEVVRSVIARLLRASGYEVVEADDGESALARAAELPRPPDLVITDVVMPRMSGPALIATLRERWPRVLALLTSGYEVGEIAGSGARAATAFLQKPFTLNDLVARVESMLGSADAAG